MLPAAAAAAQQRCVSTRYACGTLVYRDLQTIGLDEVAQRAGRDLSARDLRENLPAATRQCVPIRLSWERGVWPAVDDDDTGT